MVDVRAESNGNINIFWVPEGGLANPNAPTAVEMAAAFDLSAGIVWDGLSIGATGTNELDDRGILDSATATSQGTIQYGATIPYFYPKYLADVNDDFARIRNIFKAGRVKGYLITSVLQNPQYKVKKPVAGDWVSVYKVISDSLAHDTEGEDSYKFTIEYLPQGLARVYTLVKGATGNAITLSAAPTLTAPGDKDVITATLHGKNITQGAEWTSSDSSIVSVSPNGVVVRHKAGTATISANHPAADAPKTVSIGA